MKRDATGRGIFQSVFLEVDDNVGDVKVKLFMFAINAMFPCSLTWKEAVH